MFDPRVWSECRQPVRCRLDLSRALPRLGHAATRADRVPLWLRAGGVRFEAIMDGEVLRCARLIDGQWLVCVRIRPQVGEGTATMTLWVTADAVKAWPPSGPEILIDRDNRI